MNINVYKIKNNLNNSLLIISDGKLQVTWHNTLLLVITSGITSKLEDFSSKIFKYGGEVDYSP